MPPSALCTALRRARTAMVTASREAVHPVGGAVVSTMSAASEEVLEPRAPMATPRGRRRVPRGATSARSATDIPVDKPNRPRR